MSSENQEQAGAEAAVDPAAGPEAGAQAAGPGGRDDAGAPAGAQGPASDAEGPAMAGAPSEAELRAAYEEELSRVTATDIIAQTVVSLINIGARRLGLTGEPQGAAGAAADRDLEQVRDAIDGARALMAILERTIPQELAPLRDALARLQMAYAREVGPGAGEGPAAGADPAAAAGGGAGPSAAPASGAPASGAPASGDGPGPAESSGRLWVPGR